MSYYDEMIAKKKPQKRKSPQQLEAERKLRESRETMYYAVKEVEQ